MSSDLVRRLNDLFEIEEEERNKAIKLLSKIFKNILSKPTDPKFRDLNFSKIRKKLDKCKPAFYLLYCAGFNQNVDGSRLQWDYNAHNQKLLQTASNGLQSKIKGEDVVSNEDYGGIVDPTQTYLVSHHDQIVKRAKKEKEKLLKLQQKQEQEELEKNLKQIEKMETDPPKNENNENNENNAVNADNADNADNTANNEDDEDEDEEMRLAMKMSMQENGDDNNTNTENQDISNKKQNDDEDDDTTMNDKSFLDQLESMDVLKANGKPNEMKMINDPEKGPSAYQWDDSSKEWKYIGEIMASSSNDNKKQKTVATTLEDAGLGADDLALFDQIKASKGFQTTLKMEDLVGLSKEEKIAKFGELRNKFRKEKQQSIVRQKLEKERRRREGIKAAAEAKRKREEYQRKMVAGRKKREKAEAERRKKAIREKIAADKKRKQEKKAREQAKKNREKLKAQQQQQE